MDLTLLCLFAAFFDNVSFVPFPYDLSCILSSSQDDFHCIVIFSRFIFNIFWLHILLFIPPFWEYQKKSKTSDSFHLFIKKQCENARFTSFNYVGNFWSQIPASTNLSYMMLFLIYICWYAIILLYLHPSIWNALTKPLELNPVPALLCFVQFYKNYSTKSSTFTTKSLSRGVYFQTNCVRNLRSY